MEDVGRWGGVGEGWGYRRDHRPVPACNRVQCWGSECGALCEKAILRNPYVLFCCDNFHVDAVTCDWHDAG